MLRVVRCTCPHQHFVQNLEKSKEATLLLFLRLLLLLLLCLLRSSSLVPSLPVEFDRRPSIVVFFVDIRPLLLALSSYITVIPGSQALHVRNVVFLDFALFEFLLGVKHGHEVFGFSLLEIRLKCLEAPGLEGLWAKGTKLLFGHVLLFLGPKLAIFFGTHAVRDIGSYTYCSFQSRWKERSIPSSGE